MNELLLTANVITSPFPGESSRGKEALSHSWQTLLNRAQRGKRAEEPPPTKDKGHNIECIYLALMFRMWVFALIPQNIYTHIWEAVTLLSTTFLLFLKGFKGMVHLKIKILMFIINNNSGNSLKCTCCFVSLLKVFNFKKRPIQGCCIVKMTREVSVHIHKQQWGTLNMTWEKSWQS